MKLRLLLAVLVSFLLSSCVGQQQYHGAGEVHTSHEPNNRLHVLEIDEQGDFWNPEQLNVAIECVKQARKPPLLLTYVHGWDHNAAKNNDNLQKFTAFVESVAKNDDFSKHYDVQGLYVGWRGKSASTLPLHVLSFWNRKTTAQRIGRHPLLSGLLQMSQATRSNKRGGVQGRSVIIGHSFGARITEQIVGNAAIASAALLSDDGRKAPVPFDAVFLINQASESLRALQLKSALANWPYEKPLIVSLSSETDCENRSLWPLGLWFQRYLMLGEQLGNERSYPDGESQWSFLNRTGGHDPRQITHYLYPEGKYPMQKGFEGNATDVKVIDDFKVDSRATWCLNEYRASSVPARQYSKAYWMVRVPKELLDGHGGVGKEGIFHPKMQDAFEELVRFILPEVTAPTRLAPAPNKLPKPKFELNELKMQQFDPSNLPFGTTKTLKRSF